jgi:3-dehydroquinate synthase
MRQVDVELGDRSYPILIGEGLLSRAGCLAPYVAGDRVLIVSNDRVAPLYLEQALATFAGKAAASLVLPDGESHKNLATLGTIFDALIQGRYDRGTTLAALGGGVIGDLTGFAAATYQRGIDFVQLPTTLLAQVDSSVGGKTGVNHPGGKNLIGAFHQPRCVLADTRTLATLPERELCAGLAEVIKYGLIADADFFAWLEANMPGLRGRAPEVLEAAIERCCQLKASIVAADERERGMRALLNFGHTFGHAIEAAQRYRGWLHGEAVAAGMAMAARLSLRMGRLSAADYGRILGILAAAGLPQGAPAEVAAAELRQRMASDKKVERGQIRLVLLNRIGDAEVTRDYPHAELDEVLRVDRVATLPA